MHQFDDLLLGTFLIFVAAKIVGEVFERLKLPAVLGEILAGVLIGPSVLKLVKHSEFTAALSEIGVILLLFQIRWTASCLPEALPKLAGIVLGSRAVGGIRSVVGCYCLCDVGGVLSHTIDQA